MFAPSCWIKTNQLKRRGEALFSIFTCPESTEHWRKSKKKKKNQQKDKQKGNSSQNLSILTLSIPTWSLENKTEMGFLFP